MAIFIWSQSSHSCCWDTPQGYQCEFIDQVFDDLYCKKCTLVARRLTITTCCAESFCQDCIASTIDPCPACGENDFTTFQHAKNQKRINNLRVKERECGWSGTLEKLDSHLDPDQDNCQYVDTKCPLNCQQTIPKNKMEQHVAEECVKSRGVIPGGAGGATAPQLLANNTFGGFFTHY